MCTVDCAGVLVRTSEDFLAVDEIDVFVAAGNSVVVGVDDDLSARNRVFISAVSVCIKVGAGHHNYRDIGVRCADLVVDLLMSITEMLYVRGIVVVIEHESRHIEPCHIVNDRVLALAASRKTEVEIVEVDLSRQYILINVTGSRSARALRD